MILQSLTQLYERLKDAPDYQLPTPGYSIQNITFRIVLNADGSLHDIQDARQTVTETTKSGKAKTKLVAKQTRVPGESKPPGQGINPCYFWDNSAYLLGYKKPDKNPTKAEKEAARALETLEATKEHYLKLASEIPTVRPIADFYNSHWSAEMATSWADQLKEFAATGFGVFRIIDHYKDVHDLPEVVEWWNARSTNESESPKGICLVSGEKAPIARIHDPAIKGVNGAAAGGAKLASFNLSAFESYTQDQSFNAPVSEHAAFAYCNTLNALLSGSQSYRHRVAIGDATTIFWTEKPTATESLFAVFLDGKTDESIELKSSEDQATHKKLQAFLNTLRRGGGTDSGSSLSDDPNTKFFILGLSGNVTRLSVRFWHISTIGSMLARLKDHYANLALTRRKDPHPYHEPEFPAAQRLLDQSARERKAISPLLGGQLMQAILYGTSYPMTLYQGVLNRIRSGEEIDYLKTAIFKATLIRNFNHHIDMSLNTERTEPAYLLGRLFAALEKTQEDALGKVNAGIRERFYSSASATPGTVFPRIMRTYQHHLSKIEGGMRTNREKLIQSIHASLESYPSHLLLEDQGLFAIGYYHQRQAFFTKQETSDGSTSL